jgi:uncharacterized protein (TIGR02391 family)
MGVSRRTAFKRRRPSRVREQCDAGWAVSTDKARRASPLMSDRPSLSTIPLIDLVLDSYLDTNDVAELLEELGDITSGTKSERVSRLKQSRGFDPARALRRLSRAQLAELCRQRGRYDRGEPKALIGRLCDVIKDEAKHRSSSSTKTDAKSESWWSLIHPNVRLASESLYATHHYAPAVLQSFIALNSRVKEKVRSSGIDPKDGTALMRQALNVDAPIIQIPSPGPDSARETQEGYQHIFAGSMLAVRDPKAHQWFEITEEQAVHFLFLGSLLMYKLDEAGVK